MKSDLLPELLTDDVKENIAGVRSRAILNNKWMAVHSFVNRETGEILQKDGKPLSMADVSRSWYSEQGGRNNARMVVARSKKAFRHPADVKIFRPKFITLTFADTVESWQADRAIQKFLNAVRTWAKRQKADIAYFWTSEVQKRGAAHYHILFLGLPYVSPAQLAAWWSYGFYDVRALDDVGRAFKYIAKYLWKWGKQAGDPETLPDWWFLFSVYSRRRFGFSKFFQASAAERVPRWATEAVKFLELAFGEVVKCNRASGGGWELILGTELIRFKSPFEIWQSKRNFSGDSLNSSPLILSGAESTTIENSFTLGMLRIHNIEE